MTYPSGKLTETVPACQRPVGDVRIVAVRCGGELAAKNGLLCTEYCVRMAAEHQVSVWVASGAAHVILCQGISSPPPILLTTCTTTDTASTSEQGLIE
jgi:hypothetical protein